MLVGFVFARLTSLIVVGLVWHLILYFVFVVRLGQDLVEYAIDRGGLFKALIENELQPRRVACIDSLGDFGLQKTSRTLKPTKASLLLRLGSHDRDVDFRRPHVGRDF